MNDVLVLIHDFLTFVKSYCFLPLLLGVAAYAATYGISLRNSAWSDIRNTGTSVVETNRLAYAIFLERRAKRDPATVGYIFGLPPVIALLVLSLIYG
jgi:hypothetical protein